MARKIVGGLVLVVGVAGLGGCASTIWEKPGASPQESAMDDAQCRLLAEGANPDFGAPAIDTGSFKRDFAVNAVAGILHGIDQGLSIQHTHDLCMQARGYTARAPGAAPEPLNVAAVPSAAVPATVSPTAAIGRTAAQILPFQALPPASEIPEPNARTVLFPVMIYHPYHPNWIVDAQ